MTSAPLRDSIEAYEFGIGRAGLETMDSRAVRHPVSVSNRATSNFRFLRRVCSAAVVRRWPIRVAPKIPLVTMFPLALFSAPDDNADTLLGYVSSGRSE